MIYLHSKAMEMSDITSDIMMDIDLILMRCQDVIVGDNLDARMSVYRVSK